MASNARSAVAPSQSKEFRKIILGLLLASIGSVVLLGLSGCAGLTSSTSSTTAQTATLAITTASLPNGHVNALWSDTLTATGGKKPYTWSVVSGSTIPAWLSLDPITGQLSGTPTQAGTSSFTVQVTDSGHTVQTKTKTLNLTISSTVQPVSISTTSLPNGVMGQGYSSSFTASGGTAPYAWSAAPGSAWPTWLILNASTGALSGTPSATVTISVTVQVTDSSTPAQTASKSFSFNIVSPGPTPPAITTSSLPPGQVAKAYSDTLAVSGGTAPYTWSVSSGTVPGLALAAATGQYAGMPSQSGNFGVTVKVSDSSSPQQTTSKSYTVAITAATPTPVVIGTTSVPGGQVATAYSTTLSASGGTAPYSWSISSGALPGGLGLAAASGTISGTPTAAGSFTFTVKASDSGSTQQSATTSFTVTIVAAAPATLSISSSTLGSGQVGTAYSGSMSASGGTSPYTWSVSSGSLPAGLALTASTGKISGTPTQSGSSSFTITVSDSSSPQQTASKSYSITIAAAAPVPLAVVTTTLTGGQVNLPYSTTLSAKGGTTPYQWSLLSGTLPPGLSLNASTGVISGTPTQTGSFPIQVQVADSSSPSQTASQSFTLSINTATAGTPVTVCGTLGNSGSTYVLQNDISAVGTCITIGASGITFNLNGHTITYDTGATASVYGITASSLTGITGTHITNGAITQGSSCGFGSCLTAHPVYLGFLEADHLTVTYFGDDNQGISVYYGNRALVHDNKLCPNHTKSVLNHYKVMGEIGIEHVAGQIVVNNNSIGVGCPNMNNGHGYVGIFFDDPTPSGTLQATNNQISMASPVRDGYAIEIGCANSNNLPFEIAYNTINQASGRGILVAGWSSATSPGCGLGTIHDNVVSVKEAANEGHGNGDAVGIQTRFGAHDIQVYNNTVTLNVGAGMCPAQFATDTGSDCSGTGVKLMGGVPGLNLTAYNNKVTATSNSPSYFAGALYGDMSADSASYFANNTAFSNSGIIATSPANSAFDGCGNGWTFKNNTLVALSNPQAFHTYVGVYYCNPAQASGTNTDNNVFVDNTYQGGAAPDDLGGPGQGNPFSYYVKWTYNVTVQNGSGQPMSGVTITAVAGGGGAETVSQVTDASGNAQLVLTDHFASGTSASSPSLVDYTPHTVTITAAGCTVSTSPFQLPIHQITTQTLVCQ
jgi:putative Ig domain-containing protein